MDEPADAQPDAQPDAGAPKSGAPESGAPESGAPEPDAPEGAASHDPVPPEALLAFVRTGWAPREPEPVQPHAAAPHRRARRDALAARFPDERLVVPSGRPKVRSNDTYFSFRPGTAFLHLVGSVEPGAVLVLEPDGEQVLYQPPTMERGSEEFFTDRAAGELWVGPRPSLAAVSTRLGITTRPLADLATLTGRARVLQGLDDEVAGRFATSSEADAELAQFVGELRMVKDDHEINQLQEAVEATIRGFEDVVRQLDAARGHARGERWIEGVFGTRARVEGNDVGYGSICAAGAHACTLHWTDNDGPVTDGELVLLDMGVEGNELYTADITRTLPVSGTFSPRQRAVYDLVHRAQQAGLEACKPGADFLAPHRAAMSVLAHGLERFGILADADKALEEDQQLYRRYTLHGTSHHLGLDVHDCAGARREQYREGTLQPGHVITVEPGLYFQPADETVPEDLRGIGVRIEDDVVITEDGCRTLSAALPSEASAVEAWMAGIAAAARER